MPITGKTVAEPTNQASGPGGLPPVSAELSPGRIPPSGRDAATNRAFVVQLTPGCEDEKAELSGRVHHLSTADGGSFDSTEGLLRIMRRVLGRTADALWPRTTETTPEGTEDQSDESNNQGGKRS